MADEKIQLSIYKLEQENLTQLPTGIAEKNFLKQELEQETVSGYKLELYYRNKPSDPKWKDFLCSFAKEGQDILEENQSRSESFILILEKTNEEYTYAVTGGQGYFAIQDYINENFGIDVFSRLIKKEDKILKSTKEKSFVGGILGTTKHFRKDFNLFETDSFGKIYQELKAGLDPQSLIDNLGFTEDDIKKSSACIAKSSFKINKAISFSQLLTIINGCENILATKNAININNVQKINKKKDADLVAELENALLNQLWERYTSEDRNNSYSFDLCHKEVEKYLTASSYIASKNMSPKNIFGEYEFTDLIDIDNIMDQIEHSLNIEKTSRNKAIFANLLKSIKITSYDEEGNIQTRGKLLSHILGDVSLEDDDKKYFYIDNSWYLIKANFITDLDSSCKDFIKRNYIEGLDRAWDYPTESEGEYNRSFIGDNNTIVLDRITPDNIEPCDILKWDDGNLYFYHVKAGFGNTMRDLCSQVIIAASRILQDVKSSNTYAKKIYLTLRNKIGMSSYFNEAGNQTNEYTEEFFVELFEKKLVFVLAVLDTASDRTRDIREVEKFKSTIAKFSLQELTKEMQGIGIDFKIFQIPRSPS
jgi:uncharacterized protein (TIGR04141 family)